MPFELRTLAKIEYTCTSDTVCHCNSSETSQQNFMNPFSYEGHAVKMCIFARIFYWYSIFFSRSYDPFEVKKIVYTTETVCHCNTSEIAKQNFVKLAVM